MSETFSSRDSQGGVERKASSRLSRVGGCLMLPFRLITMKRLAIVAILLMPGKSQSVVPPSHSPSSDRATAAVPVRSGSVPNPELKKVHLPGVRALIQQWFVSQASFRESWAQQRLHALGRMIPEEATITSYSSSAGKEGLPEAQIAPETSLVVVHVGGQSPGGIYYVFPDGTVLTR